MVATASDATIGFTALARDISGNIFVSTVGHPGSDKVLKYTSGVESTFATGLNNPRGLAFDSLGDLYVTEALKDGDILRFTPGEQRAFSPRGSTDRYSSPSGLQDSAKRGRAAKINSRSTNGSPHSAFENLCRQISEKNAVLLSWNSSRRRKSKR